MYSWLRGLLTDIQYWWVSVTVKERKHYLILNPWADIAAIDEDTKECLNDDGINILLIKKPYDGIIICVSDFSLSGNEEQGLTHMTYSLQVLRNLKRINLKNDERFRRFVDNIMRNVVASAIREAKKEKEHNEDRDTNTGESGS